jgi:hypothetical protein
MGLDKSKTLRRKSVMVPKHAKGAGELSPREGVSFKEQDGLIDGMGSPDRYDNIEDKIPRNLQDY